MIWNSADGAGGTMHNYWEGGERSTYSVSVNIGIAGTPASVNFGLSFSQDTYQGFGAGASVGIGTSIGGEKSPFGIGLQIGVSPYGGGYAGANLNYMAGAIGSSGLKESLSLGLQTNFKSLSGTLGGSIDPIGGSGSLLGASISSSDIRPSFTVGGGSITSVNDANKGKISTFSDGSFFPIPIIPGVLSLGLGYQNVRYWSSTSSNLTANGVLNNRSSITSSTDLTDRDDDNYSLLDPINSNIIDNADPLEQLGGTFPNFDNYSVTAQGLSGSIRPYALSTILYNQNRITDTDHSNDIYGEGLTSNVVPAPLGKKWQFRFINDLSNSYQQGHPWNNNQEYNFDGNPQFGNNDGDYGYDSGTNRLEGTNHIEYFTNAQIKSRQAANRGFIDFSDQAGFVRANCDQNQIGGFMITNSSGVTYHYALPAYSSGEVMHTENISQDHGLAYSDLTKKSSYAYTWYLTAITGPDYVSRGAVFGNLNKADWGYWVKFDYGKWTDLYFWRNPSEGDQIDLDNQFKHHSSGVKDVYYLDAIETRTHTALFVKNQRNDGRSKSRFTPEVFDNWSVPTLSLSYILLLKNDQFNSSILNIQQTSLPPTSGRTLSYETNVIDVKDIDLLQENLTQNCLRKVAFNYDYSLSPGVPNSFGQGASSNTLSLGKLCLLSVDFQGKSGTTITPPTEFQYDLDQTDPKNMGIISITSIAGLSGKISVQTGSNFKVGEIILFSINGVKYYCTLLNTTDNGTTYNVLFLNNTPGALSNSISATKTKNPPYNKDAYDNWGSYKSDFMSNPSNENLARMTSSISKEATDVWSLRKIKSGIGTDIAIDYEGNTYRKSVLTKSKSLILLNNVTQPNGGYTADIDHPIPAECDQ
ncbi:hypothetical protein ACVW0P_002624 [Mucilaginibacter sp. UYNi724]